MKLYDVKGKIDDYFKNVSSDTIVKEFEKAGIVFTCNATQEDAVKKLKTKKINNE